MRSSKHEQARQGERQGILDFVRYLEELEEDLEEFTPIQKRDILLNKIRPEYRRRLMENGQATRMETRDEVIAAVALLEASIPWRERNNANNTGDPERRGRNPSSGYRGSSFRSKGRGILDRSEQDNHRRSAGDQPWKTEKKDLSEITCFNCQEKGHLANRCLKEKTGEAPGKRPRVNMASSSVPVGSSTTRLEAKVELKLNGKWKAILALIDSGAEDNFVSKDVLVANSQEVSAEGPAIYKSLPDKENPIYGTVRLEAYVHDTLEQTRRQKLQLRAIDLPGIDLILGMPWLQEVNPFVNWRSRIWRHQFVGENIAIVSPSEFADLITESPAFAMLPSLALASVEPELPQQYKEFEDVFSEENADSLPPLEGRQHAIELEGDTEPPYSSIYALSEKELGILREYLEASEAKGWIRRSKSPAGAPILFVPKKDGTLRLCVDYRGLNKITVKNRYPLPLIGETLDRLRCAKIFTSLDLRNAYHRIRIRPGDEWKTAFRTRYGHFEYQVMPFGMVNAPATFQAYINEAMVGLVDIVCVVYLDDILIYSEHVDEHVTHVRQVLQRLREYRLYAKLSKCAFSTTKVNFLGFVVSVAGVSMEDSRVQTITEWPTPSSFKEVQMFIGFVNFYRRFIKGFSALTQPLTSLLRGSRNRKKIGLFQWGPSEQ